MEGATWHGWRGCAAICNSTIEWKAYVTPRSHLLDLGSQFYYRMEGAALRLPRIKWLTSCNSTIEWKDKHKNCGCYNIMEVSNSTIEWKAQLPMAMPRLPLPPRNSTIEWKVSANLYPKISLPSWSNSTIEWKVADVLQRHTLQRHRAILL